MAYCSAFDDQKIVPCSPDFASDSEEDDTNNDVVDGRSVESNRKKSISDRQGDTSGHAKFSIASSPRNKKSGNYCSTSETRDDSNRFNGVETCWFPTKMIVDIQREDHEWVHLLHLEE